MKHVLFLFVLLCALPAQAAQLRLECPVSVGVGLPFTVRVVSDRPVEKLRVEWGGKTLDIPGDGATSVEFLLGSDVLHSQLGPQPLRVIRLGLSPVAVESTVEIARRSFQEQRLDVPEEMATPPAEVQERIVRENGQVRAILGKVTPVNHLSLPLNRPVVGRVTSAYGLTRFFNGQPRNPHRGLDLQAKLGEPVQAASPGQVVLATEHYYAGRCVFIDHGWGVFTMYMHLDEILVQEGGMVEVGQTIGLVGKSGRVTAPHLHFGLSILDLSVDPTPLFFPGPGV